ncbi:hypothetical protein GGQ68_002508 [Sagittula marina]|uniref:Uncharacterized protein n=1 Tax=Sagittula marina TaxID=943940 RepID=A0A7W6DN49_9RHOB|nr:hypothetical protein [Sagittula marina]MBB3986170.1 hypothetical protein [Sagittula marina]
MKAVTFIATWLSYQPGETAGFPKEQADVLIASGKAHPAKAEEEEVETENPTGQTSAEVPERKDLIEGLIHQLDPETDFTQSGKPEVGAINDLLPADTDPVTAEERDLIWQALNA